MIGGDEMTFPIAGGGGRVGIQGGFDVLGEGGGRVVEGARGGGRIAEGAQGGGRIAEGAKGGG